MSIPSNPHIVWVDLETTGLSEATGLPLEIAVVFTDQNLVTLWEQSYVVGWSHEELPLSKLDPYILELHSKNGLLDEVFLSDNRVTWIDTVLSDSVRHEYLEGSPPLAGSTISFDRAWLRAWFPKLHGMLHYRNLDVSSFKETLQRWRPDDVYPTPEEEPHRAVQDIHVSIDAMKHYRKVLGL